MLVCDANASTICCFVAASGSVIDTFGVLFGGGGMTSSGVLKAS